MRTGKKRQGNGRSRTALGRLGLLSAAACLGACTLDFDEFKVESESDLIDLSDAVISDGGRLDFGTPPDYRVGDGAVDGPPAGDTDGDGVDDATDNCPAVANPDQADTDADGVGDACEDGDDGDGVPTELDNCPNVGNADQLDFDRDGDGDACDTDADGDTLDDAAEAARGSDPRLADTDGDGLGDATDTCPRAADPVGLNRNATPAGDACDPDDDGDGVSDWLDNCPGTANPDQADADMDGRGEACAGDADGDGVPDAGDNCPGTANPDQASAPCRAAFSVSTYDRDARALSRGAGRVAAATRGGLLEVDPAFARFTNAQGLADNALEGVYVDAAGRRFVTTATGLTVLRPDGFAFSLRGDDPGGGPQGALRDVVVDAAGNLWVSSDLGLNVLAGGQWALLAPPALPSADVRRLAVDALGRVWVATAAGVVRVTNRAVDRTVTGIAGLADDRFNGVAFEPDGAVWVYGESGAARFADSEAAAPQRVYSGFVVQGVTVGPRGNRWLATTEGLRRIDADGRLYPASSAVLPSPDVRDVNGTVDGPRWAATADGIVQVDGVFATFPGTADQFGRPCASTAARIGGLLWVGTDMGVALQSAEGAWRTVDAAALPAPNVRILRRIGDEVWVGTDGGIGIFDALGTPISQLRAGDGLPAAPITDIIAGINGQIWVASEGNGIARRNADLTWTGFSSPAAGANFLSNQVRSLAHDGATLWIGTAEGLSAFSEATQTFLFPVTTQGGQLPDIRVQDLALANGHIYVATPFGVAVRNPANQWSTLRRATGGWPSSAGSDFARAIAHDGTHLWVALADSVRQPNGVLVRRLGLMPIAENSEGEGITTVFSDSNAGLVNARGQSVSLEYETGELFFSVCGTAPDDVGGLSVLDGVGVVTQSLAAVQGLPGDGSVASLTRNPDGGALFSSQVDAVPVSRTLSPGPAGQSPASSAFVLPPSISGMLRACDLPPGGGELWCALEGVGVGRRLTADNWVVLDKTRIREFGDGDVRDIAVEAAQSVWIATAQGVVRIASGNVRLFNAAGTNNGLPGDDVRAVTVAAGKLYAATATGVGIFDSATMQWTALRREPQGLGNADARDVAVSVDGTLYIATADGLFRRAPDGTLTDFHFGLGLPSNDIRAVAVHADGRVVVGTAAGLAIGTPDGAGGLAFVRHGFAGGLPGRGVYDVLVAVDGTIWVRSDDGVAQLVP
jgi:ligand-binding sensor domain-containing protein